MVRRANEAKMKLEVTQSEEKKFFSKTRNEFEHKTKGLHTSNQDLKKKLEALQKKDKDSSSFILKQKESLHRLKKENAELKRKNDVLKDENQLAEEVETGIKRKI